MTESARVLLVLAFLAAAAPRAFAQG